MALSNRNNLGGGGGVSPSGEYVEVHGNGVKTTAQCLNELHALIDFSKVTNNAKLESVDASGLAVFPLGYYSTGGGRYEFCRPMGAGSQASLDSFKIAASNSTHIVWSMATSGNTVNDTSSVVLPSANTLRFYY